MSPILVAGLTIATRFIPDELCARAASGHATAPPSAATNSRRFMSTPRGPEHCIVARRMSPLIGVESSFATAA